VLDGSERSTMRHVLGLSSGLSSGIFSTTIFLGSPLFVNFVCDELHSEQNVYAGNHHGSKFGVAQPIHISPVISGFGEMNLETNTCDIPVNVHQTNIGSTLHFHVHDSYTNEELIELNVWGIELTITCKN
jgi:hypothetical protein